jgi:hypothetical protein
MAVPLAIREASAIPGWERGGLSAHLPGVEAQDFTVAVLEVEDSQEVVAGVFQEGVAEVVAEDTEDTGKDKE